MSEILKENHIRELTVHEICAVSGGDNDDESLGYSGHGGTGNGSTSHGGGGSEIADFTSVEGSFPQWE